MPLPRDVVSAVISHLEALPLGALHSSSVPVFSAFALFVGGDSIMPAYDHELSLLSNTSVAVLRLAVNGLYDLGYLSRCTVLRQPSAWSLAPVVSCGPRLNWLLHTGEVWREPDCDFLLNVPTVCRGF
jgi:hypothetical protein